MLKIKDVSCGYLPFDPLAGQIITLIEFDEDDEKYSFIDDKPNLSVNLKKTADEMMKDVKKIIKDKKLIDDWNETLDGNRRLMLKGNKLMTDANKDVFHAFFGSIYHEWWTYQGPEQSWTKFDGKTPKQSPLIQYLGTPEELAMSVTISNDDSEGSHEESWYEHFNEVYVIVPNSKERRDALNSLAVLEALNSRFAHAIMEVKSEEDLEEFGKFYQSSQGVQPIDRFISVITGDFETLATDARKAGLRISTKLPYVKDVVLDISLD